MHQLFCKYNLYSFGLSFLSDVFLTIEAKNFSIVRISKKEDVWTAFVELLKVEQGVMESEEAYELYT